MLDLKILLFKATSNSKYKIENVKRRLKMLNVHVLKNLKFLGANPSSGIDANKGIYFLGMFCQMRSKRC